MIQSSMICDIEVDIQGIKNVPNHWNISKTRH